MRVGFVEPFGQYPGVSGAGGHLNTVWQLNVVGGAGPAFVTGLGLNPDRALYLQPNAIAYNLHRPWDDGVATSKLSLAFALRIDRLDPDELQEMIYILDNNGAPQMSVRIDSLGFLRFFGEGSTEKFKSVGQTFNVDVIYRCCMTLDMTVANATVLKFWANGVLIADTVQDFQDTALQNMLAVRLVGQTSFSNVNCLLWVCDDMFAILDECVNLGELNISMLGPIANDSVQWTPLTGVDNAAMVDERPHNGDTDYNYSSVVGNKDKFTYADLPAVPDKIWCVSQVSCARKEESGTRTIRHIFEIEGVEYPGVNLNLSQSYLYVRDHYLLNPDGNIDWTAATVNALKSGYEDVA